MNRDKSGSGPSDQSGLLGFRLYADGRIGVSPKTVERLKAAESVSIPEWLEYSTISGLSREMRETLERIRPMTIGQASRIPGVTPAALTLVHVSIKLQGKLQSKRQGEERRTPADSTTR